MADDLTAGLRESLVTLALQAQLAELPDRLIAELAPLAEAEAPDRISRHLARVIRTAIAGAEEGKQATEAVRLAKEVLRIVGEIVPGSDVASVTPVGDGEVLRALLRRQRHAAPHRSTCTCCLVPETLFTAWGKSSFIHRENFLNFVLYFLTVEERE